MEGVVVELERLLERLDAVKTILVKNIPASIKREDQPTASFHELKSRNRHELLILLSLEQKKNAVLIEENRKLKSRVWELETMEY